MHLILLQGSFDPTSRADSVPDPAFHLFLATLGSDYPSVSASTSDNRIFGLESGTLQSGFVDFRKLRTWRTRKLLWWKDFEKAYTGCGKLPR
jgi:hypothetical protein